MKQEEELAFKLLREQEKYKSETFPIRIPREC